MSRSSVKRGFSGRATLFTCLDDARADLDAIRRETFYVTAQRP